MRFSILRQNIVLSIIGAGLLFCNHASADGGGAVYYSDRDVTGGVVIRIEDNGDLAIRERNGKERNFRQIYGEDETLVKVNGRKAAFDDIKVGMRVQIAYYKKINGRKRDGTDIDPLPITSIKAKSGSEKPES